MKMNELLLGSLIITLSMLAFGEARGDTRELDDDMNLMAEIVLEMAEPCYCDTAGIIGQNAQPVTGPTVLNPSVSETGTFISFLPSAPDRNNKTVLNACKNCNDKQSCASKTCIAKIKTSSGTKIIELSNVCKAKP